MDNEVMESFSGRLKVEMFYGEHFQTVDYYNNERIVSKLRMSPVQYRIHSLANWYLFVVS